VNPYLLLIAGIAWVASIGAAGWIAYGAGKDHETAIQAREDRAVAIATDAAASAAAGAIARIEIKQVTIRQQLEREVREKTVFRDCRAGDDVVRMLNAAAGAASAASAAGDGQLPRSGAAR